MHACLINHLSQERSISNRVIVKALILYKYLELSLSMSKSMVSCISNLSNAEKLAFIVIFVGLDHAIKRMAVEW
mgnify:CR=1 FL=1